ncbi:biotin transporter BioY [Streptomyces bobili]|uniref:biotin transporter BioY n=1 Tax=Streptomyces bobili TaxID=67280 RepID=UPI0037115448
MHTDRNGDRIAAVEVVLRGFVLAAALVGELARRGNDRGILGTIGLMTLRNAVIYLAGTAWPAMDLHLGAQCAIALGVTPFLVTDALKPPVGRTAAARLARRGVRVALTDFAPWRRRVRGTAPSSRLQRRRRTPGELG